MGKILEELIDNLPYGSKAAMLETDDLWDSFSEMFNRDVEPEGLDHLLALSRLDLSPVTDGLNEKEARSFRILVGFLLAQMPDFGVGGAFVVLLKRFMLPMAERKQALEKMILALGGEKNADTSSEAH